MNVPFRRQVVVSAAVFLSLFATQFARSTEAEYFHAKDVVSPGSDLTYFDLALQFAPGLASTPVDGSDISKLRHLGGDVEQTTIASPLLGSIERIDIKLDGKPALLLMFDLGYADESAASVNILALFDMSGKPRLLDTIDVGLDRETSFLEQGHMELSSKAGMAFVRNSHHNAGEEYLQTSLIGIWDTKLHHVDTVSSLSWYAGDEHIEVRPSFAPVEDAVALDATFSVKRTHCDGGCEFDVSYPSTTERHSARYSWHAAAGKFVRPAKAFDTVPRPDMDE